MRVCRDIYRRIRQFFLAARSAGHDPTPAGRDAFLYTHPILLDCTSNVPPAMSITVNGTAVPSGSTLTFPGTQVGIPVTQTVTVSNTAAAGSQDLLVTDIATGDFTGGLGSFLTSIKAGGSVSAPLTYEASAVEALVGSYPTTKPYLTIASNDPLSPYVVDLSASAINGNLFTASGLTLASSTVSGGTSAVGTVTIAGTGSYTAAPYGGIAVLLASSNTAAASVPLEVIVPSGATTATFNIPTSEVTTSTNVTLTASMTGNTSHATATLTVNPAGTPPTVTLNAPPNNASYTTPATVPMTATATAQTTGASIAKVEFYASTTSGVIGPKIGEADTPDANGYWDFTWANVLASGTFYLSAKATDVNGLAAFSAQVPIVINAAPALTAPTLSPAGARTRAA